MEPAALTAHCTKPDVMTSLSDFGTINQPTVTALRRENFSLVTLKEKCRQHVFRVRFWVENARHQHIPYIGFDVTLRDSLCAAAADLQINTLLEAFHVTRLGMTHADTTCSYSTSWETLIFKTFGSYNSLQPSSTLQLQGWFWQHWSLCVYFVNKRQMQLYY